jgi:hypothetical protein
VQSIPPKGVIHLDSVLWSFGPNVKFIAELGDQSRQGVGVGFVENPVGGISPLARVRVHGRRIGKCRESLLCNFDQPTERAWRNL